MSIQLRKLHLLIQHFNILQLRHTTFITQSLKEIHSGRETGLIDTGFLYKTFLLLGILHIWDCLAHMIKNSIDFAGLRTPSKKLVKGRNICCMAFKWARTLT